MKWNQPVGKKAVRYPTKQTVNLAVRERKPLHLGAVVPAAIALALVVGLFCKFGVIDRLNTLTQAENAAARAQEQLAEVQMADADYDQVLEEYQSRSADETAGGSQMTATPMECLTLLETNLMPSARVESFSLADGVMTVKISGVTLNQISAICRQFDDSQLVDSVQVYTASTMEQNSTTTATLNILMTMTETTAGAAEGGSEG